MKVLDQAQAARRTKILRLNILLGFIVLIATFLLMVTGEYSSIAERKAADSMYNLILIGSVLYMAGVWFFCNFTKPFWKPDK
ncbi:MAG: hypothetical protein OEX07_16395 [Gammaproteobacteria bacterium]|nr:hypothetical protein [Gammaproteobacteria bacterium]